MMRIVVIVGLVALVLGCAPMATRVTSSSSDNARQAGLKNLRHWVASGRISIVADDEAWNGNLHWRQTGADVYDIRIIAPLGQGTLLIKGDREGVELRTSDGKAPLQAATPEELLERSMGWQMPLSGMRFWILGIKSPHALETISLDENGRPAALTQSGWNIKLSDYRLIDRWYVPGKIEIENDRIKVKMLVQSWKLEV